MDFWTRLSLRGPPCNHHPWVSCIRLFQGRSLSKQLTILFTGNMGNLHFQRFNLFLRVNGMCLLRSYLRLYQFYHKLFLRSNVKVLKDLSDKSLLVLEACSLKEISQSFCRLEEGLVRASPPERADLPQRRQAHSPLNSPFAGLLTPFPSPSEHLVLKRSGNFLAES